MGALGLALLSAVCWGTADFFGGLTTRRNGIVLVGAVSQAAGMVAVGLVIVITHAPMPDGRGFAFETLKDRIEKVWKDGVRVV